MVVGIGHVDLRLHGCRSLKGKRKVVKAIIARVRNRFNVAMAEVGANDRHGLAQLGFALVGNDKKIINSKIDKIFNFIDGLGLAELFDTQMEMIVL